MAVNRRQFLGWTLLISGAAGHPAEAGKDRSYTATHGAAPFVTEHLVPASALDLSRIDLADPKARVIALTIDDGPDPRDLDFLAVLAAHQARATFFYVGQRVAARSDLVARVAASGNEIGNHSQTHPMLTDLAPAAQHRAIAEANAALAHAGVRPAWFRPPFGDFDSAVVAEARASGLATVLWTIDTRDWKGLDSEAITRRVVDRLQPGAIVLLHSTKPASLAALPAILEAGTRAGYRFVTMTGWQQAMAAASRR